MKLCGSGLFCGINDSGELVFYVVLFFKGCFFIWVELINVGIVWKLVLM